MLELAVMTAVRIVQKPRAKTRLSATIFVLLYGRAWHRSVGAIHTTIALQGFEELTTRLALVEPLTRISRHRLLCLIPADWACQNALKIDLHSRGLNYRCFATHRADLTGDLADMAAVGATAAAPDVDMRKTGGEPSHLLPEFLGVSVFEMAKTAKR
ncbi:hypothetical protein CLV76_1416 [Marivita geojedonensis]|nr:hypothetical protein CLV76_1416 [Marivita geojedonensis]